MGYASLRAKDFKSDYAKEQLRENVGQSESKKRSFKHGFKEDYRSKVLKNCKRVKALKNKDREKKQ
jgi:hypothetical protein